MFNEGYSGDVDLAAEAIRLTRQLAAAIAPPELPPAALRAPLAVDASLPAAPLPANNVRQSQVEATCSPGARPVERWRRSG